MDLLIPGVIVDESMVDELRTAVRKGKILLRGGGVVLADQPQGTFADRAAAFIAELTELTKKHRQIIDVSPTMVSPMSVHDGDGEYVVSEEESHRGVWIYWKGAK